MTKTSYSSIEESLGKSLHRIFVGKLLEGRSHLSSRTKNFFKIGKPIAPYRDPVVIALEEISQDSLAEEQMLKKRGSPESTQEKNDLFSHPLINPEILKSSPLLLDRLPAQSFLDLSRGSHFTQKLQEAVQGANIKEVAQQLADNASENMPDFVNKALAASQYLTPSIEKEALAPLEEQEEEFEESNSSAIPPIVLLRQHLDWIIRKDPEIFKKLGITNAEIQNFWEKRAFLTNEQENHIQELLSKSEEIKKNILKRSGLDDNSKVVEKERKKHINKRYNIKETWLPLQ